MRSLSVVPGESGSVQVTEMEEPPTTDGPVLVEALAVGVCGTDLEIVAGEYGEAPPGEDRLVLGHESLGRVLDAPADSGLQPGDLVVGIVRRPDPVPCPNCAVGEWDMCRNGRYTEHGIKGLHGFARERYRAPADSLVRVAPELGLTGVLLEPTSVVAKAWEHIERIGARARYEPSAVLVTGAGPIGLLAALLGVQRGLDVHVLDIVPDGPKPRLVADLGATYHCEPAEELDLDPDVVIECTGVPSVVAAALSTTALNGITCLTGVSSPGRRLSLDLGQLNRDLVLENDVVFGSVNANRRHYEAGARALAEADGAWLDGLLTRRVPLDRSEAALTRNDDDVKVMLDLTQEVQR
jgi:threonine dehydrogenase-like Zn-dependent dehydrogenase